MTDEHPPLVHAERSQPATRILAIRRLLIEKGVVTSDELDDISTADFRYRVLPRRPPGTKGLGESALAELVTRDSMIGVAEARPGEQA